MTKKALNLTFWKKGNNVLITKFKLIKTGDEFKKTFENSTNIIWQVIAHDYSEVKKVLSKKDYDKFHKLDVKGIILFADQDESGVFEVTYWESLTNVDKIKEFFHKINILVEELPK